MSDQGEIQSQSVESRLAGLADRLRTPTEPPKQQAETPTEEASIEEGDVETQTEVTQEPEAQAQTEAELAEVEYEGKTHKVDPAIKDAILRHADYTRKTQEVAERRRTVEQREQMLMQTLQLSEQLAPAFGHLSAMDQQIQSIRQQLTPQLRQVDPLAYNTLATDLGLLQQDRNQFAQGIEGEKQKLTQAMEQARKASLHERLQDALPKVQSAIKGFSPQTAKQIAEFAKSQGFSQEELEHISFSAPAVISLWKAAEYDRIQAAKLKAQPKGMGNLPPVAKPGARGALESEQSSRQKETLQAWRKGGGKNADQLASILKNRLK